MDHGDLVGLLDDEVSLFVRAAPAAYSPRPGYVQCYTCGAWVFWKNINCGHFVPRHRHGTRYDLRNVRPQCVECNKWHEGEHWLYRKKLIDELGEKEVEALELTASLWGMKRHPREWLIEQIKDWRIRNKPLRKAAEEWQE